MEPPPPATGAPLEAAPRPPISLVSRLLNVFATPGEVFADVKTSPSTVSNWMVPGLLLVLVSWLGMALAFSQPAIKQQLREMTDKQIEKQAEKAHLSPERAEQMRHYAELATRISFVLIPLLPAFVFPWIWGLFLWLAGSHVMKGGFDYLKAVEMVGLSNMIAVLDAVVKTLLIVLTGNLFASPSLALLVKDFNPQNVQHSAMAIINIMSLWHLSVRSIGLARLASVSVVKAAFWVFGFWMAYTGLFWGIGVAVQKATAH